jgi:hypothetical protein
MSIPSNAIPLPLSQHFNEYRANTVAAIRDHTEFRNGETVRAYQNLVDSWLATNARNRELGLALTPKPVAPSLRVVRIETDAEQTIWVWFEAGTPAGPPCPDLPPLPERPPDGTAHVGEYLGGVFYRCPADDTMLAGSTVTVPPANGAEPGQYRKVVNPWGALYEKVA